MKRLIICGRRKTKLLNEYKNKTKEVPVYCDNRCCLNPLCKKHRSYKFKNEHEDQIGQLKKYIQVPKSYIFTTPTMSIYKMTLTWRTS